MYSDLSDAQFTHVMRDKGDSDIVKLLLTPVNNDSEVGGSEQVRVERPPIKAVPPPPPHHTRERRGICHTLNRSHHEYVYAVAIHFELVQ